MKNITTIIAIVLYTTLSCKAQSPIISIEQNDLNDDTIDNTYVKDINHIFDPYFGTWKWEDTSTNTSFTVEFSKIEAVYDGDYYEDLLIGKYKFVKNGIELFNSLNLNVDINNINTGPIRGKIMYRNSGYLSNTMFNFQIYDNIKHEYCKAQIELLTPLLEMPDGTTTINQGAQLRWRLSKRRAIYVDNEFSMYDYTSYPEYIILTKQP